MTKTQISIAEAIMQGIQLKVIAMKEMDMEPNFLLLGHDAYARIVKESRKHGHFDDGIATLNGMQVMLSDRIAPMEAMPLCIKTGEPPVIQTPCHLPEEKPADENYMATHPHWQASLALPVVQPGKPREIKPQKNNATILNMAGRKIN